MKPTILAVIMGIAVYVSPVICQDAPIYRVTVVERTMKAINYQYRNGPTSIDFRGTVLLPKAKGSAIVESKQGRTEIDARFENLTTPQGFGLEYMAYVLWAITPEGRPVNLGEIVANSSDKGSLHVTTDLKAFGLLVTAEPYGAVRQPSDVVVAENHVREDTIGKIEEIGVKYELMPRGHYTYNVSGKLQAELANAPKVSMHKYEALLELYQAQNAVAIAKTARADTYAPNTFAKAQFLLNEAEQLNANKNIDSHRVVDSAREAAQTAEDARQIADRRMREEQLAQARANAVSAEQARLNAEAATQRARADADQARLQADSERAARMQAEADAASARERARQAEYTAQARTVAPPLPPRIIPDPAAQADHERSELRMRLLEQLNGTLATRDTAFGLMVTVPDRLFAGTNLRPLSFDQMRRISAIVTSHPGLRVVVEGHSDSSSSEAIATRRAEVVRDQLVASGLAANIVEVRRMGDSRLLGPNSTEAGREQNRRVEVIIAGDPIGKFPFWDHPYTLTTTGSQH
jgi:outer membrane protein OmpA-like peptidoglycan-associated protein